MEKLKHFAVIVAAGKGQRMGLKLKKQYIHLDGIPVLTRTIMAFDIINKVDEIILVIPKQEEDYCKTIIIDPFEFKKKIHLVEGGKKRSDSVLNGLNYIRNKMNQNKETIVMIHDGVRPFVNSDIIKECILQAREYGACIPAVKISDTIKHVYKGSFIQKTVDRENLYSAQTPQTFKLDLILRAFNHAEDNFFSGTDEASIVEYFGHKVFIIKGSKKNIKITTQEDLSLGKYLLTLNLT